MPDNEQELFKTELIQKVREGDRNSFKGLYDLYKDRVFSTAIRILGNVQDAEDAAQEIFIRIFRTIKTFREDAAFSAWVYKIAVNTCINHLKKRKRCDAGELPDSIPDETSGETDTDRPKTIHVLLERQIARLPEKCRTVFILHEIEGFNHEEIAEIMGISPGTSKSQLFFARSSLREKLKPFIEVLKNELP